MLISQTKLFFFSINQVPGIAKTGTGQRRILGKRPMQRSMQRHTQYTNEQILCTNVCILYTLHTYYVKVCIVLQRCSFADA